MSRLINTEVQICMCDKYSLYEVKRIVSLHKNLIQLLNSSFAFVFYDLFGSSAFGNLDLQRRDRNISGFSKNMFYYFMLPPH